MKTTITDPTKGNTDWCIVDLTEKTLGRAASQIASYLRGKNTPHFETHRLQGPRIIVINAEKIHVTGKKRQNKMYEHYTGYPGGLKSESFERLFERFPTRIVEKAIKGMLPKNALGRAAFKRVRVYAGATHPHTPQYPQVLEIH